MELRQLKYFIRAAELSNFTKASEELFITQSTLSQQIKELENSLNISLFDRIGKRVKLTEAGEIMLQYARKTIYQSEESKQVLRDLNNLKTGKLIIGSTYGLTHILINSLTSFSQEYPDIQIQIVFGSTLELLKKLRNYELDCILSFLSKSNNNSDIETVTLFTSTLSLIVHKSHPWSRLKKISLKMIKEVPLVIASQSYSIRNYLDEILTQNNVRLNIQMEINDIHSLLKLTNTKRWNTILMSSSLFDFSELRAIPLEERNTEREATITFLKDIYHKKAMLAFQKVILEKI
ncbi:LysR substrate-binding domain-containing protein [Cloacibacterium sp.]|uniref:LysR substrate-binding domain-containing protein n=1 Tax=Cloacibacterium sp. TaxID=1913682 RepID=UPI0039E363F3